MNFSSTHSQDFILKSTLQNCFTIITDSEKLYTEVFTNVCAKYGKQFTWELKRGILGFQGHECAEKIITSLDLPLTVESFMEECKKENEVVFVNVSLMPGMLLLHYKI